MIHKIGKNTIDQMKSAIRILDRINRKKLTDQFRNVINEANNNLKDTLKEMEILNEKWADIIKEKKRREK